MRQSDPYLKIAQAIGFSDHVLQTDRSNKVRVPVLIQRTPTTTWAQLARDLGATVAIELAAAKFSNEFLFASAQATEEGVRLLSRNSGIARFELAAQLRPARMRSRAANRSPAVAARVEQGGSGAGKVLFATIDTGCPFMHPLLCHTSQAGSGPAARETRVRAIWDQDQHPDFGALGRKPAYFSYGAQVNRDTLNGAIKNANGDEKRCYESLGYDELRHRGSHGSHSLGMMLGYDKRADHNSPAEDKANDVVFVQLPRDFLLAPSRAALARYLLDGLLWIASQRRAHEKLVISIGKGSPLGPHDGTSLFSMALDQFIEIMGDSLVGVYIASGNEYDSKLHAVVKPSRNKPAELVWRVPPCSEMPAFMELWLPNADSQIAPFDITLIAPDGAVVFELAEGEQRQWPTAARCQAAGNFSNWSADGARLCLLRLAPTLWFGAHAQAASGDWRVRIATSERTDTPVHAYLNRVTPTFGYPPRGRQSHFVHSAAGASVKFDAGIDPKNMRTAHNETTLQDFASSTRVVSVGGYIGVAPAIPETFADKRWPAPAKYTSSGSWRNGHLPGPTCSAMTDEGHILRGRRSIGSLSGTTVRMDGTSVAAPLAARALAGSRLAAGGVTEAMPLEPGSARSKEVHARLGLFTVV